MNQCHKNRNMDEFSWMTFSLRDTDFPPSKEKWLEIEEIHETKALLMGMSPEERVMCRAVMILSLASGNLFRLLVFKSVRKQGEYIEEIYSSKGSDRGGGKALQFLDQWKQLCLPCPWPFLGTVPPHLTGSLYLCGTESNTRIEVKGPWRVQCQLNKPFKRAKIKTRELLGGTEERFLDWFALFSHIWPPLTFDTPSNFQFLNLGNLLDVPINVMTVTKEFFTFLGYNSFLISSYVIVGLKVDHPLIEYSGPLVCQLVQYTSAIGSIVALWSSSGIALMRFFYIKVMGQNLTVLKNAF